MKYSIGCVTYSVESFKFPAGEVGVKLTSKAEHTGDIKLTCHLKSSDDVIKMLLTTDAIRRQHPDSKISAFIPYIPYARQDRVCSEGESLSISVMCNLINSCNFDKVSVVDPHSDVVGALLNRVEIVPQEKVFRKIKPNWADTYIVAPDAGAYKKSVKFASHVGAAGVVVCNKVRDLKTGNILSVDCSDDVSGKNLLVLDDICDGGRTFIEVAGVLKGAESLELAVTHGIFSKGVDVVAKHYDAVYTTNTYHGDEIPSGWENIKLIKF